MRGLEFRNIFRSHDEIGNTTLSQNLSKSIWKFLPKRKRKKEITAKKKEKKRKEKEKSQEIFPKILFFKKCHMIAKQECFLNPNTPSTNAHPQSSPLYLDEKSIKARSSLLDN